MASAHIKIDKGTQHSAQLREFVDDLYAVQDKARRLKGTFDQAALGGDWESLGLLLGITAAEAETVYNLMGSVKTELEAAFITQVLGRLG